MKRLPSPPAARRRILPLRPTAAGIYWLLAVVALLASAVNYGNNLIFALAFLLLAVWLQAGWTCHRHLAGLVWQADPPAPVFAGEALCIAGRLSGASQPEAWAELAASGRSGAAAGFDAQGESTAQLAWPTTRRGAIRLDDLHLRSRWPLDLWQASRRLPALDALVYPRPAGALPLPGGNPRSAHRQAASDDFQGLRPYVPGDSPRRINWRVYSRSEQLAVNRFDGAAGGAALWLDWERVPGDGEQRLAQLTAWLLAAEHGGREYGLRLPGQVKAPGRGRAQHASCLKLLALYPVDQARNPT